MSDRYESIAIDGPAGSGKSTVARQIAEALGYLYVDTGAMYRSVAYSAQQAMCDLASEEALLAHARGLRIRFNEDGSRIFVNDRDVSEAIRTPEVTAITKYAARVPPIRLWLRHQQQAMARARPVVMEGRDITTVVLPGARWKFFLSASPEERARRRVEDFSQKGHEVSYEEVLGEVRARDESDYDVGPLKDARDSALDPAGEVKMIETTRMTPTEVIQAILATVRGDG